MSNIHIIYRATDAVDCFSGRKRDFYKDKFSLIEDCYYSFIDQIKDNRLSIVLDRPSEKLTYLYKSNELNVITEPGNGSSFKECIKIALASTHKYIFFIEDDYLFKDYAFYEIEEFIKIREQQSDMFSLYPSDYPDRYKEDTLSSIVLGKTVHWRTINKTTCTFLTNKKIVEKFKLDLLKFSLYGKVPGISEDNTINMLYKDYPCFSPIPSLAEHMQYKETLSPFYFINDQDNC